MDLFHASAGISPIQVQSYTNFAYLPFIFVCICVIQRMMSQASAMSKLASTMASRGQLIDAARHSATAVEMNIQLYGEQHKVEMKFLLVERGYIVESPNIFRQTLPTDCLGCARAAS